MVYAIYHDVVRNFAEIASLYQRFAEMEAHGRSPLYEQLALAIAGDESTLQFLAAFPLVPEWDLKFLIGIDGLSSTLLLLTSIVGLSAVWVSPTVEEGENRYYACILLIAGGAAGAFASLDLFFFYAFHELALIPTFLMIGIWGTGNRQSAAWKITIYLSVGSIILLVGLIGVYLLPPAPQRTFDIVKLQQLASSGVFSGSGSKSIYLLLLLG